MDIPIRKVKADKDCSNKLSKETMVYPNLAKYNLQHVFSYYLQIKFNENSTIPSSCHQTIVMLFCFIVSFLAL